MKYRVLSAFFARALVAAFATSALIATAPAAAQAYPNKPVKLVVPYPPGGAADTLSLRIGNRLVGNPDSAAALEMTFVGATLEAATHVTLAITGARAATVITQPSGVLSEVAPWVPFTLRAGERLRIAAIQDGCRAYLCVRGGFDVPVVLGGRGTNLAASFGGHEGRLLRAGDWPARPG